MSTLVRAALVALAIVLGGAAILVIGYFYRAPVPDGYALPRHNWWGSGPGGLYSGSLIDRNGCIGTDAGDTIVWPVCRRRLGWVSVNQPGQPA